MIFLNEGQEEIIQQRSQTTELELLIETSQE